MAPSVRRRMLQPPVSCHVHWNSSLCRVAGPRDDVGQKRVGKACRPPRLSAGLEALAGAWSSHAVARPRPPPHSTQIHKHMVQTHTHFIRKGEGIGKVARRNVWGHDGEPGGRSQHPRARHRGKGALQRRGRGRRDQAGRTPRKRPCRGAASSEDGAECESRVV